jgi:hypothetical protein
MSSLPTLHRHSVWLNVLVVLALLVVTFVPSSTLVGRASSASVNVTNSARGVTKVPRNFLDSSQRQVVSVNTLNLQSAKAEITQTSWQIDQIVGLPKGTVIYQGSGRQCMFSRRGLAGQSHRRSSYSRRLHLVWCFAQRT